MDIVAFIECNASGTGVEAMKMLKSKGYHVKLLTKEKDFYNTLSANPLLVADSVSYLNTDCVASIINNLNDQNLSGVLAFDDYRIVTAAMVANYFALPSPSLSGLINCRFKNISRMKLGATSGNLQYAVYDLDESPDLNVIRYPNVVKPIDDSGSVGVKICYNQEDVLNAIAFLKNFRVNARGYHLASKYLIEEYITGDEYSAEAYWSKTSKSWVILGITRKLITSGCYAVEIGHDFPWQVSNYASVIEHVHNWLEATNLTDTVAHIEFKIDVKDNTPKLMEINPRPGGDMIHHLCYLATGINLIEYYISLFVVGVTFDISEFSTSNAASIRFIMPPMKNCNVLSINKYQDFNPEIKAYNFTPTPKKIDEISSSYSRLGYVITQDENVQKSIMAADLAISNIKVEIDE